MQAYPLSDHYTKQARELLVSKINLDVDLSIKRDLGDLKNLQTQNSVSVGSEPRSRKGTRGPQQNQNSYYIATRIRSTCGEKRRWRKLLWNTWLGNEVIKKLLATT
jgi:hypothetical protein